MMGEFAIAISTKELGSSRESYLPTSSNTYIGDLRIDNETRLNRCRFLAAWILCMDKK